MAGQTLDDKLRKVSFLNETSVKEIIGSIVTSCKDKNETFQVQLNLKGYENRKDPKMTKDIVFPHVMRRDPYVLVIGNESVRPVAEGLNVPFALSADFEGPTKEKARSDLIKKFKYLILCQDYQKAFNLRDILKKKKTHFMCPVASNLPEVYGNVLVTYRLKIRDWNTISFPIGHCQMDVDTIYENAHHGITFVADQLKKGAQNIKNCFFKRTTGEVIKIY